MSALRRLSIAVCIVNGLYLAYTGYKCINISPSIDGFSYVGSDYPDQLFPHIGQHQMVFPDENYLPLFGGADLDHQWKSFMPLPNTGYFHLGEDKRPFDLPMYHQLHCIWAIRKGLADPHDHHMNDGHMHHCLNYIRQHVLCSADTTLEPFDLQGLENGKHVVFERKCRNHKAIEERVRENQEAMRQFVAARGDLPPLDGGK